jgi:hypothetical protein
MILVLNLNLMARGKLKLRLKEILRMGSRWIINRRLNRIMIMR